MRFPKSLTFLIPTAVLLSALSAWAEQKRVGPSSAGPRPTAARPYVACAAAVLAPPGVPQKPLAPGLSPAGNVAPTFRACPEQGEGSAHADLKVSATTAAPEPAGWRRPLFFGVCDFPKGFVGATVSPLLKVHQS